MGVDRTAAGTDSPGEAAEERPTPDRRPPPDRPGGEGAPSRADSRSGAAAANETSDQAAEKQGEDKPDTAQASQKIIDREDSTNVENEPETPGTSESNEGLGNDGGSGERSDTSPAEEDPGGTPEPSVEIGDPKVTDQREQATDGQNLRHDSTTPFETDEQPAPAGATERTEDKGAGETPSAVDIGDRPDNAPKENKDALVSAPDTQEPSRVEGPGSTLAESTETPGQQLERPDDGAELELEAEGDAKSVAVPREQALGERLMVDGTPLHEYLDPVGAAAWSSGSMDVEPNPAGDRIADAEKDELSRFEKLRRKAYEASDDIHDITQDRLNEAKDIFTRPPAGHTEISTHPEVTPAPHDGVNAGDAATALIAAGVVIGEIFHRGREKLIEKKGK